MKILFLKTRNPPEFAFTKIIQSIFKVEAYSDLAKSTIKRYRTYFSDYRYNLKKALSTLVQELQEKLERLVYVFIIYQYHNHINASIFTKYFYLLKEPYEKCGNLAD